ncbi:sialic acid-binding Ig-like lectin 14 isoform X2 [Halichoeres trimaculatus]|uniref:sialic acid-binding Ig-like lectin 14 isoform X2 n=1 Tax=Halichoeres trimaculatus TaxID=147232 RepID=UPI003D9E822F
MQLEFWLLFLCVQDANRKGIQHWWRGFWKKGNQIISTNLPHRELSKEYRQRTMFLGDLRSRNCTMLLDGVRSTDTGPFYFAIELSLGMRFSYIKNAVTIDIIREPKPPSLSVQVSDKITASCSVTHSCPAMPPKLSWNHRGSITQRSKKRNEWKWEMVSTVTFTPLLSDFNKTLTCTVKYRGGKVAQNSTIIHI